jgi:hypothetical protein
MTTTTAERTTTKPARQSRASRGAQAAKSTKPASTKPAAKPAKPKAAPEPKGPTATELKQATTQWAVDVLAAALAKGGPKDIEPAQAAEWLGSWCQYFPGVRQQKIDWPNVLGAISGAGAAKKSDDK